MYNEQSWGRDVIKSVSGWPWTIMQRKPASLGLQAEFELPDYQRLPSGEDLSPDDLLHGESYKTELISDLDGFFGRLYSYYVDKGFWCIVIQWIAELLSLGFTICFSAFFLLFVDWKRLQTMKCGVDALDERSKPCDLVKEALIRHPLIHLTFFKAVVVAYLMIFSCYWIFCFLRFFIQLKETLKIRKFYFNILGVTDQELRITPWPILLGKIVDCQRKQRLCVVRELSAHDIVMRIMRKENYLIGMLNKGVLAVPIPSWVPGVGPVIYQDNYGVERRLFLSKTFEWSLNWCILQNMFDRNFLIRRELVFSPVWLKRRFMIVGFGILFLSPFFIIFMFVYFFLRHAEEFYHHPSSIVSRRWSNLATWIFREFNELDHMFKWRLNNSYKYAVEYVKQFPSPIVSIIAKFVSFVFGGFAAILIIIAFLEESLLEAHLFGRNLLWFAAIFGTVTAISRAAIPEEFQVFEPEKCLRLVACYTHHMPKQWRGAENRDDVRSEFEGLFQYTGVSLLEELVSIFVTPYILIFLLSKQIEELLEFVRDFSVHVEGVGHVCSLSQFDFEHHGNSKYGSPYTTSKDRRSCQGKMEKSFLSFKLNYPNWEPDSSGKQFISILADFHNSDLEMTNKSLNTFAGFPEFNENSSSSMIHPRYEYPWTVAQSQTNQKHTQQDQISQSFDCIFMSSETGVDQESLFSLLDRYYITKSLQGSSSLAKRSDERRISSAPGSFDNIAQISSLAGLTRGGRDMKWFSPSDLIPEDSSNQNIANVECTSTTLYKGVGVEDRGNGSMTMLPVSRQFGETQWWARAGKLQSSSSAVNESFLEPPMFGGGGSNYGSSVESEDEKAWASPQSQHGVYASSSILEDRASSGFHLPFGDLYKETD